MIFGECFAWRNARSNDDQAFIKNNKYKTITYPLSDFVFLAALYFNFAKCLYFVVNSK